MKDILIVEDGKQDRERLEKVFADSGFSVIACENVADAERAVQRENF